VGQNLQHEPAGIDSLFLFLAALDPSFSPQPRIPQPVILLKTSARMSFFLVLTTAVGFEAKWQKQKQNQKIF